MDAGRGVGAGGLDASACATAAVDYPARETQAKRYKKRCIIKAEERYFAEVSGTWLINGKPLAMWFIGEGLTLSVGVNSTDYGFQFFLGTLEGV